MLVSILGVIRQGHLRDRRRLNSKGHLHLGWLDRVAFAAERLQILSESLFGARAHRS